MANDDSPGGDLHRLIEAGSVGGDTRRSVADRVADRLGGLGRQRQIDHALVGRLAELQRAADRLKADLIELVGRLAETHDWLTQTAARGDAIGGRLEAFCADQERANGILGAELDRLGRLVPDDHLLTGAGEPTLEEFNDPAAGRVVGYRDGAADSGGGVYRGFEDVFRGSEEEVRDRQKAYLPLLNDNGSVLDIGCGRGELLELLRDRGISAAGIDLDAGMVQRCRDKGLAVQLADAATHLEALDESTLGAVFAAQVVEHLPYGDLLRFLRASVRALNPGGIVILETVNPHSPQALKHFWIDPTHQHPLFPETLLALCRLTGFVSGYIWYPYGSGDPEADRRTQPDYAVVVRIAG